MAKAAKDEAGREVLPGQVSVGPANDVRLVGRMSGAPATRVLPSGDEIVTFRLVVDRPPVAASRSVAPARRAPTVDTIDCVAYKRALQRLALRLEPGTLVEARGSLRRRFWRTPHGAASRCEVEVVALARAVGTANASAVARAGRKRSG